MWDGNEKDAHESKYSYHPKITSNKLVFQRINQQLKL
jgi:hypothetical protein